MLLDAVIVRSVVVPALMLSLGKANWHMPAWLERRLPRLRVEGRSDAAGAGPVRPRPWSGCLALDPARPDAAPASAKLRIRSA